MYTEQKVWCLHEAIIAAIGKQGCVSIISWQHFHTLWRQRSTQNRFIIISIISGMLLCCKNLSFLLWGTFLWGLLFGRTCWTCLNPPLRTAVVLQRPWSSHCASRRVVLISSGKLISSLGH